MKWMLVIAIALLLITNAATAAVSGKGQISQPFQNGKLLQVYTEMWVITNEDKGDTTVGGYVFVSTNWPTKLKITKCSLNGLDTQGKSLWALDAVVLFAGTNYIPIDTTDGIKGFPFHFEPMGRAEWGQVTEVKIDVWVRDFITGDIVVAPLTIPLN